MKKTVDDGFNSQWVEEAYFDGLMEIPIIRKPEITPIPEQLVPFSCRRKNTKDNSALCFYEADANFNNFIYDQDAYLGDLKKFGTIVTPDCSLYIDMPFNLQIADIYFSRAVGCKLQKNGHIVVPNVRWGDERTYTTMYLPEKVAFLGIEKGSMVAIGTYGQISTAEYKRYFREGLIEMLDEIEPPIVLVYGGMPEQIFRGLRERTIFVQYQDWISLKKGGRR